jgi:ABC-type transporter Mla subunit MlaD
MIARLLSGPTHTVTARLSGLLLAIVLLASVGGYAALHYGLLDQGPEYEAEFANAWPLVAGMDVRVSGAVAGSVRKVALTNRGTAEVTFQLQPSVPQPRADATVAIRQSDLLGDTDLSLSLGTSPQPLAGSIPISRSIQEPRLDDFLNIFHRPVRTAMKALIVELGTALENRGVDVNAAILKLRPGFTALGDVFTELQSQIGALRQVLTNSHALTSQLATRTYDLDQLIVGLDQTIGGVASRATQLDLGLAELPATLSRTRATLGQVRTFTSALRPLAQTVVAGAPGFGRAAGLIGPYARALSVATKVATPTVELSGDVLRHSAPAFRALHHVAFADLFNPTGGLFSALAPVLSQLADGLFGTNHGGGLGGIVLPGNDATAPNIDPARDYLSAYLVISCELFGVKQGPGCLSQFLSTYENPGSVGASVRGRAKATRTASPASGPPGPTGTAASATGLAGTAIGALQPVLKYLLGR